MGIIDRFRGKLKEMREEAKKAREAERKLRLAEEKQEAKKYVEKARKAGVELTEEEAIALVRKKKKGGVIERLQKAGEVADAFAKEFSGDIYKPKPKKSSKGKKKGKSKTQKQAKRKSAIDEINDIGSDFSELLGFGGKKGKGRDPFDFWDLL